MKIISTSQYRTERKHWKEKLPMEFHWRWSQKCCCLITDGTVAAFHLGSNNTACSLLLSTVAGTQVKPFKFVSRVCNMDGTCCLFYISLCSCQWSPLFRILEATFVSPSEDLLSFNTLSPTCRNLHGYSEGPMDFLFQYNLEVCDILLNGFSSTPDFRYLPCG